jgi:two-component system LytT family response regulator
MTGFRVLVVDDEPLARAMVGAIVQGDADVASVVECGDARQVHELIAEHRPHIVFLDIEMPELSGIGVAEMVDDAGPAIVFVTAFSQYATRAFDVKAIDYVLKPFSDDRLREALERAKRRIRERRLGELAHELSSLSANLTDRPGPIGGTGTGAAAGPKSYLQRLAFKVGDRSVVLKTSEIHWIEAEDYYVLLHTARGRHLVRVSMASLEAELDPTVFVRAHRAAIVNLDAVQELTTRDDSCLRLVDGTRVPVSRARRRHVEAAIGARG